MNRIEHILELQRQCDEQRMKYELEAARQENRERMIDFGIRIITVQMNMHLIAMFFSREEG